MYTTLKQNHVADNMEHGLYFPLKYYMMYYYTSAAKTQALTTGSRHPVPSSYPLPPALL